MTKVALGLRECKCGKMFAPHTRRHVWCDRKCPERRKLKVVAPKPCPGCDTEFVPESSHQRYCNRHCRLVHQTKTRERSSSREARGLGARAVSLPIDRVSRVAVRRMREDNPEPYWKPKKRRDCENMVRPCAFVSCRHHMALDVEKNGTLKINFPDRDLSELKDTCGLDAAAKGPMELDAIGVRMNITRERVRQIERKALRKLYLSNPEWYREMRAAIEGKHEAPAGIEDFEPRRRESFG